MNIRSLTTMAAVVATLTIAAQARADQITFYLTQPEGGGAQLTPSNTDAVEVTVTGTMGSLGDYTQATVEFLGVNNGATLISAPALINVNVGLLRHIHLWHSS